MRKVFSFAILALAVAAAFGCNNVQKPADLPELYPCKVTVIQDGAPLADASVILVSPTNATRFVMGGITDAQGVAEIKTDAKFKGAPAGSYKVLISKMFVPEMPSDVPPEDPEARAEYDKKLQELNAQQAETVDVIYKNANKTPAEIEVTTSGAEATFDVGEKVNVPVGAGGNS